MKDVKQSMPLLRGYLLHLSVADNIKIRAKRQSRVYIPRGFRGIAGKPQ